ncbi:MAG: hypothetical protein ACOCP8_07610 [archaeon]
MMLYLGLFYYFLKATLITALFKSAMSGKWIYNFIFAFIFIILGLLIDGGVRNGTNEKRKN